MQPQEEVQQSLPLAFCISGLLFAFFFFCVLLFVQITEDLVMTKNYKLLSVLNKINIYQDIIQFIPTGCHDGVSAAPTDVQRNEQKEEYYNAANVVFSQTEGKETHIGVSVSNTPAWLLEVNVWNWDAPSDFYSNETTQRCRLGLAEHFLWEDGNADKLTLLLSQHLSQRFMWPVKSLARWIICLRSKRRDQGYITII